jgi:hypothetical protein
MSKRTGVRIGIQKQGQAQVQIQLTEARRVGMEELGTWQENAGLPGVALLGSDLGYDEEADGDQLLDDGDESATGEPSGETAFPDDEAEDEREGRRQLTLPDLLGSRSPVVLLRLVLENDRVVVRLCSRPTVRKTEQALELLRDFLACCFADARSHFSDGEWSELLGLTPAPLVRRLTLLLRVAVKGSTKVHLGEGTETAFTPHDIGLERFASKFAALPDGTPFSLRLLLLDERGRERGNHFFDQLPDTIKLLALRRALRGERQKGVAVSDLQFRGTIQQALEELLGMEVDRPTEDQVRRRLRDNFKRKGLGHLFPNQAARQQAYDRMASAGGSSPEESR